MSTNNANSMAANGPVGKEDPRQSIAQIVGFVVLGMLLFVLAVGLAWWKWWNRPVFYGNPRGETPDVEKQSIHSDVNAVTPLIVAPSPVRPERVEYAVVVTQSSRRAILLESPTKLLESRGARTRWSLPPLYFEQPKTNLQLEVKDCTDTPTHSMVEACDLKAATQAGSLTATEPESSPDGRPRWPSRFSTKRKPVPSRNRPATGPRVARFREEGVDV